MSHPSLFFYAQLVYAKQDGMRGSWMTYCPQKETGGKVHLQSWVRLRNRTLFTNCTFNSHHCIALNKLRGQNGSIVRFLLITEFVKLESLLSWNNPAASLMWILVSALLYDTIYCFLFFFFWWTWKDLITFTFCDYVGAVCKIFVPLKCMSTIVWLFHFSTNWS